MGNLPTSRTETCITGAPVSHNLMNEIQDMIVGDRRPAFSFNSFPIAWTTTGVAPTLVINPQAGGVPVAVWKLPAAATHTARLRFDPGDTLASMLVDVYGDGVADWTMNLTHATNLTAAASTITLASTGGSVNNSPASWTRYDINALGLGGGVVMATLPVGYLELDFILSGGGAQIYVGEIIFGMSR